MQQSERLNTLLSAILRLGRKVWLSIFLFSVPMCLLCAGLPRYWSEQTENSNIPVTGISAIFAKFVNLLNSFSPFWVQLLTMSIFTVITYFLILQAFYNSAISESVRVRKMLRGLIERVGSENNQNQMILTDNISITDKEDANKKIRRGYMSHRDGLHSIVIPCGRNAKVKDLVFKRADADLVQLARSIFPLIDWSEKVEVLQEGYSAFVVLSEKVN